MINKTQDMNEMQTRMEQMARVIHNKVGKGMRLGIMFWDDSGYSIGVSGV